MRCKIIFFCHHFWFGIVPSQNHPLIVVKGYEYPGDTGGYVVEGISLW